MKDALAKFSDLAIRHNAASSKQLSEAIRELTEAMKRHAEPKLFVIEEMP